MNEDELLLGPLCLVAFALAGATHGTLFVIGKLAHSRGILGAGWAFFALQGLMGMALLGSRSLGPGGKIFVAGSLLGFALLPSLAWAWARRAEAERGAKARSAAP
ncbi:hypothetical protein [Methylacidimicrobium sp. B4]|uniref:hypothetical protein n=1 Tax=Methylacidimicrobium sp. B4 TaxID=2796139 RepID=UPI001A8C5D89|nr:hypothetical protein [Methylacidimicrobium sp. B4]QSR84410.1 hypothetical protein MacB4_09380 [Methylacidimicrobium sp. B4]